jgi:hypothetical protein
VLILYFPRSRKVDHQMVLQKKTTLARKIRNLTIRYRSLVCWYVIKCQEDCEVTL